MQTMCNRDVIELRLNSTMQEMLPIQQKRTRNIW